MMGALSVFAIPLGAVALFAGARFTLSVCTFFLAGLIASALARKSSCGLKSQ
jgi:hypothetical protein